MPQLFILALIVIIAIAIAGFYAGKKRREAMQQLALRLGLRFSPEHDRYMADRYEFLNRLRQGSNRYAYNVLSGCYRDHEIKAFDYHYETHSTDSKGNRQTHHHCFSFFILELGKAFPELTITKEGFFSKLAQTVGFDDIDFESHEFSRRFAVRSKDKKFAYDFCNARMIDYLLGHPDINIEVDRHSLALGFASCLQVEEIEPHLEQLIQIRERMPDYLFDS